MQSLCCLAASAAMLAFAPLTSADEISEVWPFNIFTAGEDVFYTSPTAVDPNVPRYRVSIEIELIEVTASWLIFTQTVDVTEDVDLSEFATTQILDGPAPIEIFNGSILYPEPPEDPSVAADIEMTLDADGFGQLAVTNVFLGTADVEIPNFGMQTVQIEDIRFVGDIIITPLYPGDLNCDGLVNVQDLLIVISNWGAVCDPEVVDCPGDANGDGVVNVQDLLMVISNWGFSASP